MADGELTRWDDICEATNTKIGLAKRMKEDRDFISILTELDKEQDQKLKAHERLTAIFKSDRYKEYVSKRKQEDTRRSSTN